MNCDTSSEKREQIIKRGVEEIVEYGQLSLSQDQVRLI